MAESQDDKVAAEPKKESLTEEQLQEIACKLEQRGAIRPCHRCGKEEFQVLNAYLAHTLQFDLTKTRLGGQSIPCAVVVCKNCGYLSQHALGAIGLLDKGGGKDE